MTSQSSPDPSGADEHEPVEGDHESGEEYQDTLEVGETPEAYTEGDSDR